MEKFLIESPRLFLRKIQQEDFSSLKEILSDIEIMYAWEHAFSDEEIHKWINENLRRYEDDGYSYFAVIEKSSCKFLGVCGLIDEHADSEKHLGIGYIFNKKYWGNGFAFESAESCIKYAADKLKASEITAQIRPENLSSRRVAEKLGMTEKKQFVKIYNGKEMPHILYCRTI